MHRPFNFARLTGEVQHHAASHLASAPVKLVPIKLDLEIDGVKVQDAFTWNLNEVLVTNEQFAQLMVDDLYPDQQAPGVRTAANQIAQSIRQQCEQWAAALDDNEDIVQDEVLDSEWRQIVKLDLQVGEMHYQDQFEWPLNPSNVPANGLEDSLPTPEGFAKQLCTEQGLSGEFVSLVAHSIREQICSGRLNFEETPKTDILPVDADNKIIPYRLGSEVNGPSIRKVDPFEERERQDFERVKKNRRSQRVSYGGNTIVINRFMDDEYGAGTRSRRNQSFGGSGLRQSLPPPPQQQFQQRPLPYRNYRPSKEEEELMLRKLEQTVDMTQYPPQRGAPQIHRGFGASAGRFNQDGSIEVSEYRKNWRCTWCMIGGQFTPTIRKGPNGPKTLCNSCGIWYGKHGSLPKERFQEHLKE